MSITEIIARALWDYDASFGPFTNPPEDETPGYYHEGAFRAFAALEAHGYAVVPKEPTGAMIEAGWFAVSCDHPFQSDLERGAEAACWSAMIQAGKAGA